MEEINVLTLPPYFGSFTCLCLDPKASWVACGTNTGHLAIWDLRFNLLIKTIRITRQDERAKSVTSCVVHPSKGKGRHLILALQGDAEGHSSAIQVWDIEHGIKTEEFITGSRRSEQPVTPDQTCANPTTASEAIEAFLNRQGGSSAAANSERVDAVYTLAVGSDYTAMGDSRFGNAETTVTTAASADDSFTHVNQHTCFMLSGGEDRHLRFWDLNNVEQSMILLSPEDNKSATYTLTSSHADAPNICVYEETAVAGPTRLRPTAIALAQQNMLRAHQDAITAVALLQLPYKTIITGDRKGVIKVSS